MPKIKCLRCVVESGAHTYPLFIGYMSAEEILQVAVAPAFTKDTYNSVIAQNATQPPVRDWQRPLDGDRVNEITKVFNNTGEFMPNPVLLSQNVMKHESGLSIKQVLAPGSIPTDVWEVDINETSQEIEKSLWILDGQHRINGLSKSKQKNNSVPVVLLLNLDADFYNGPNLAKIFAQVTTAATKLQDLHNEWLTYAFRLDKYSTSRSEGQLHARSMEVVTNLCVIPILGESAITNPFRDKIQFNDYKSLTEAALGGFAYTCRELKDIIFEHYYNASSQNVLLTPLELAVQLGLAVNALSKSVKEHSTSVFFGDGTHGQKIMQNAFIVGILSYIRSNARPDNWLDVLNGLAFTNTVWNFKPWVKSLSGRDQSVSKKIAYDVFTACFRDKRLPDGTDSIADYLSGDNASILFEFCNTSSSNKKIKNGREEYSLASGVKSRNIGTRRYVKIINKTPNIGELVAIDKKSPPGRLIKYTDITKKGLVLDETRHSNPLELIFQMHFYGGTSAETSLNIQWSI